MTSACKKNLQTILLSAMLILAWLIGLLAGRYSMSIGDIIHAVTTGENAMDYNVFVNIRLPRTILTIFSGMGLALSGWAYQSLFMNALVSPDILGVSSGCSVGAIIGVLMGFSTGALQLTAAVSGLIAVGISMGLASCIGRQRSASLLLSGIIVGALCNACIMMLKYIADPSRQLAVIDYWLMGSFHTAKWRDVHVVVPVILICGIGILILRHPIRLMSLGDEEAQSLGAQVRVLRPLVLVLATAMVAAIVSVAGIVSWIGLIVPHISRILLKRDAPLPCLMLGGILLLVADTLARCISAAEIPISILTSLMGAAFLAFVLIRMRGKEGTEL